MKMTASQLSSALGSRFALSLAACAFAANALAGNCVVLDGKKIGDCANVHVGPPPPLDVKKGGSFSGNFGRVTIRPGVNASISGNTDDVIVRAGATLYLTGNSGSVRVEGVAELSGNSGWVHVAKGGMVTIRGIADGVSGPGKVVKVQGSIIGGIYTIEPSSAR
ncbi:hypothetical protein [Acidovorax sp. NO-1]|uniref:hypothetical protein n=1 Tax=Acidovorax sp. NO-1 TaxID=512030 RepID=UPI001111E94E|nr:hypothetical protein [Acidovorax sp. NO-1]